MSVSRITTRASGLRFRARKEKEKERAKVRQENPESGLLLSGVVVEKEVAGLNKR